MSELVEKSKKQMLALAILSGIVLIALTAVAAIGYPEMMSKGLTVYMMAVPIFFTVLAFVLGYLDIGDDLTEGEIRYMKFRSYCFGGAMFVMSVIAVLVLVWYSMN